MIFRENEYLKPTDEQAALIGSVVMHWAIAEHAVAVLLARLIGAPDFPCRLMTDRLGWGSIHDALRSLVAIHRHRYGNALLNDEQINRLAQLPRRLGDLRGDRNALAHDVTIRHSDDAIEVIGLSGSYPSKPKDVRRLTVADLMVWIADCESVVADITELSTSIGAVEENPRLRVREGAASTPKD